MIKVSEYVSLGHPDKVADYISQYLLDRYIEKDPDTRYAVEVQIKGYNVTLGGEVTSKCIFTIHEIERYVCEAVNDIGYTREYVNRWGIENAICGDMLSIRCYISQQSSDIAQGLAGWGDQGIFFGYSNNSKVTHGMPLEHHLAKDICKGLFESGLGGLDIKTQVVTQHEIPTKVIVAIPLLHDEDFVPVQAFVRNYVPVNCEIIINGTGRYVQHSTIADCGTTGRKLAVDFYGGACCIGGGSPWTKDGSKADLTLNLYARLLARQFSDEYNCEVYVSLACCIGKQDVDVSVCDPTDKILYEGKCTLDPAELRKQFELDKPIFASMCRWGLFGKYQQDKQWEQ